ncbi:MAG: aminotransferase class V-fold PLP-dependent enzyme [Acidobacteria bacterium]|nr:aminotransferase class V-fold PLP-dependent enzyme [Acidobacteriota bacterium]
MRDYRNEFPDFAPTVYLNCAYQGPFPLRTVARIHQAIELKCHPERLEAPEYFDLPERVRGRLARLIGADPSEIALANSATQGIGVVAAGLGFKAGDEVVISAGNFPSNLFTWLHLRRLGVRVHVLKPACGYVRVEDAAPALTSRTRVLALDWVSYIHGARLELAALGELVRGRGGIFVVDGTQGVGALALNVHALPVDVLVAAGYKWLLGPYGAGFAYISPAVRDRLDLQFVNWMSVEGSDDFESLPTDDFALPRAARVFDVPETSSFLNLYALEASLEFVECASVGAVTDHCRGLLDRLAGGLRARGFRLSPAADAERQSTILGFQADSLEPTISLYEKLRANHVAVSLRHGVIRVSPYLYNTGEDIDRLLELAG